MGHARQALCGPLFGIFLTYGTGTFLHCRDSMDWEGHTCHINCDRNLENQVWGEVSLRIVFAPMIMNRKWIYEVATIQ